MVSPNSRIVGNPEVATLHRGPQSAQWRANLAIKVRSIARQRRNGGSRGLQAPESAAPIGAFRSAEGPSAAAGAASIGVLQSERSLRVRGVGQSPDCPPFGS